MRVGFLGLGRMGEPMATNLRRADLPLTVWNRSAPAARRLAQLGAVVRDSPAGVLAECDLTLLMLANATVIDGVLDRGTAQFADLVRGRLLVHMGTTSPGYSEGLGRDIVAAGGRYVEAPVSGSRVPAQRRELVAMLAGRPDDVDAVEPVVAHLCGSVLRCGDVPAAMTTKLAVNVFLITLVSGLAESFHFAERHGVDLDVFRAAITSGQMASPVAGVKLAKLMGGDLDPQAGIADVYQNAQLITAAARASGTATPLMDVCDVLFRETRDAGLAQADMAAVVHAVRERTARAARVSE